MFKWFQSWEQFLEWANCNQTGINKNIKVAVILADILNNLLDFGEI